MATVTADDLVVESNHKTTHAGLYPALDVLTESELDERLRYWIATASKGLLTERRTLAMSQHPPFKYVSLGSLARGAFFLFDKFTRLVTIATRR